MKITINKESSVKSIQEQFNVRYPFLKIEFYKNYSNNKPTAKIEAVASGEFFRNLSGLVNDGAIDCDYKRSVTELESEFKNKFGVIAQVFRKSGNLWIETSLTDDWTLEQQNKEGEQISSHFPKKIPGSIIDFLGNQKQSES